MDIKILPASLSNMIAAGEVVGRPASVVKEMLENAVDAGADQISVVIKDAGRTLIQIIDNGSGMTPDQAVLCFERHATSKIARPEDLSNIRTFGFRGEALASIAAVSEVTLKTRTADDEVGCQVEYAASEQVGLKEVATPVGSNFEIRNLFYNVPARRKFLKSNNVEFKHIVEEFTRVALTRPEIQFKLYHNDKAIFVLNTAKSLKFRIADVIGNHIAGGIVNISSETTLAKISGYVGRPDSARKTLGNQYFFVNGRYFRSPFLHKAVMTAYEEMIPEGVTPAYFIYLEMDPDSLDVNISPTKTEVKFQEEQVLFQILLASVKKTLGKHSFAGSIDFDMEGAPELPVLGKDFEEFQPVGPPQHDFDPNYNPFDLTSGSSAPSFGNADFPGTQGDFQNAQGDFQGGYPSGNAQGGYAGGGQGDFQGGYAGGGQVVGDFQTNDKEYSPFGYQNQFAQDQFAQNQFSPNQFFPNQQRENQNYEKLFEDKAMPTSRLIILKGKYIVTTAKSGMMVINVKRARERILYDRFVKAFSSNQHITQISLFPVQINVGVENRLVFDENSEMLSSLGFDIVPFGNDTVVVNGVPEGFSVEQGKVEAMVEDLLFLLNNGAVSVKDALKSATVDKFAILGASRGDDITSTVEAKRIIGLLLASESPELTNSGRRIISMVSMDDIENLFKG